jgi:AMP-binding enzyme
MSNSELVFRFLGHSEASRGVSWLQPHHRMGLIGGITQPLYGGFPVTLMTAADFVGRPLSWVKEMSRTPATTCGGPNFAYELCVRKTTAAQRAQFGLSRWRVAFNGSEPIRAESMESFTLAFDPTGFSREAFHPYYGLTVATLIATGGLPWSRCGIKSFGAAGSRYGTAVSGAVGASSRPLVSCGLVAYDRDVVIVDPDTRVERTAGQVGEIWISGRGVAPSYWHRPAETRRTFSVRLAGTSERPFLRSGTPGFVPGRATAFSVANGDQERLVIAHEITRQAGDVIVGEVAGASPVAVAVEHEVQVHPVVLLPPEEIQKTSSGKIQQITAKAAAAVTEVPAASPPELTVADSAPARLYRWIRGSRVPADAAADAGSFLDPAARRPGERPCWASLAARSPSRCP